MIRLNPVEADNIRVLKFFKNMRFPLKTPEEDQVTGKILPQDFKREVSGAFLIPGFIYFSHPSPPKGIFYAVSV
jgi:hypothetical protein